MVKINKIILAFLLLLFSSFSTAAITDYNVVSPIPLDQTLTISGKISPPIGDVWCSFYITDINGNFFVRLTDEKTNAFGFFSTSYYKVTEPLLKRGFDYNATTLCGSDSATRSFRVDQLESFAHPLKEDFKFATARPNWEAIAKIGSIILIVLIIGILAFLGWKAISGH